MKSFNLLIFQFFNNYKAVAALPMVLLMGGIIVEIAIAGAFIAFYMSQSGFGVKLSDEALAAAKSGAQDAIMKIIRDKNFSLPTEYNLAVGSRSAAVIVCRDSQTTITACDTANVGKDEITSIGSAGLKRRKLKTIVNVNSITGEVKIESIEEVAI